MQVKSFSLKDGGVDIDARTFEGYASTWDKDLVGDIIRTAESDLRLVECFDAATNRCRLVPACRLQHTLNAALGAYFAELDRVTLADLAWPGSGFGAAPVAAVQAATAAVPAAGAADGCAAARPASS